MIIQPRWARLVANPLRRLVSLASALLCLSPQACIAETSLPPQEPPGTDEVFRACQDEMDRSMQGLHLDRRKPPYFMGYTIRDVENATITSELGSAPCLKQERGRLLIPTVRVGGYELDNSKFGQWDQPSTVPLDDDYMALKLALWTHTDDAYKKAVQSFESKQAFLSENKTADSLPDLAHAPVEHSIDALGHLDYDQAEWSTKIQQLSQVFAKFPTLQASKVSFVARNINRWFLNSEGTKIRDSHAKYAVLFWASTQAPDGLPISDYEMVAVSNVRDLPDLDQLKKSAVDLAEKVKNLAAAPAGEDYYGPVLFEDQGAAEFLANQLAPSFGLVEEFRNSHWRHPLKGAVGRKILPKFLNVIDDPLATEFNGTPLIGGYKFDDEGVRAQKVSLVENGVLKGFCYARTPTKYSQESNGHSMGGCGYFSILEMNPTQTSTKEEMKQKLIELGKDAGLDYVLIVRRLGDYYKLVDYPIPSNMSIYPTHRPSYSSEASTPTLIYKMYLNDGHEELVRGLEFKSVSFRTFKDIQACGNDKRAYLVEPWDFPSRHLITPSFLVSELELVPTKPEHSLPPRYPSPLSEEVAGRQAARTVDPHQPEQ